MNLSWRRGLIWYRNDSVVLPCEEKVADTAITRVSSGSSAPGLGKPVLSPSFVPKLWVYNIHSVYVKHIEFEHFFKVWFIFKTKSRVLVFSGPLFKFELHLFFKFLFV